MVDPMLDLSGFFESVLDAFRTRNWGLVVVLALLLCVSILRRFGGPIPRVGSFLAGRLGGWLSLFALSILLAAGAALMVGTPVSWGLIVSAVGVGFTAAGGYQALKDLLPVLIGIGIGGGGGQPAQVLSGSIGNPTPQQVAAFEEMMRGTGFAKRPDGSWKRVK